MASARQNQLSNDPTNIVHKDMDFTSSAIVWCIVCKGSTRVHGSIVKVMLSEQITMLIDNQINHLRSVNFNERLDFSNDPFLVRPWGKIVVVILLVLAVRAALLWWWCS